MQKDDMIDITNPRVVQVQISVDRKKLWVNVDGVCRFRAYQMQNFELDEQRPRSAVKVSGDATAENVPYAGEEQ